MSEFNTEFNIGDVVEDVVDFPAGVAKGTVVEVDQGRIKVVFDGDEGAYWWPATDFRKIPYEAPEKKMALIDYLHGKTRITPPSQEVRVTDPVTGGQKGKKPEQYSMIPVDPLAEVARVYGYGAQKYDRDNWRKGYAWSLSLDALLRHIEQFRRGERLDTESGRHHLAHAAFHLFTLMEYDSKGLGTDDRGDLPQSVNRGGSPNVPG